MIEILLPGAAAIWIAMIFSFPLMQSFAAVPARIGKRRSGSFRRENG